MRPRFWIVSSICLGLGCGGGPGGPSIRAVGMGPPLPPRGAGCRVSQLSIDPQLVGLGFQTVAALHLVADPIDAAARKALEEKACELGGEYLVPAMQAGGASVFFVVKPRPGVEVRDGKVQLKPASSPRTPAPPSSARPVVAVAPLEDKAQALSVEEREQLTSYLAARLATSGRFLVVPADRVKAQLSVGKRESFRVCYDTRCQIELGKALAAHKTLAAQLLKLGGQCSLTVNLYDLKTETAEAAETANVPCDVDGVRAGLEQVVRQLSAR